ncbi:MAG: hypothetical protein WA584_23560 [Pyrinomonadaceae bacterium]
MNREEFIEFISIDETGHHPFYLIAEQANDEMAMVAMDLNDVHLVYAWVLKYVLNNAKKIYFTMDFPAGKDIKTDFVAVHFKKNDEPWEILLLPYDEKGNRLPRITGGEMFDVLLKQCRANCTPMFKVSSN